MLPHPLVESQLRRHFPAVTQHRDAMLVHSGRAYLLHRLHRTLQQHYPEALELITEIDDHRLDGFALKIQLRRTPSAVRQDTGLQRTVEHVQEESKLVCQRCGEEDSGRRAGPPAGFPMFVSFTVGRECRDLTEGLAQTWVWRPAEEDDD